MLSCISFSGQVWIWFDFKVTLVKMECKIFIMFQFEVKFPENKYVICDFILRHAKLRIKRNISDNIWQPEFVDIDLGWKEPKLLVYFNIIKKMYIQILTYETPVLLCLYKSSAALQIFSGWWRSVTVGAKKIFKSLRPHCTPLSWLKKYKST